MQAVDEITAPVWDNSNDELVADLKLYPGQVSYIPLEQRFIDPTQQTTDQILSERKQIHGDYSLDAAMAQRLKAVLRDGENWERLSSVQRESLELICTKLGRIMVGNPYHKDHWDDVAGYARLVAQRLI